MVDALASDALKETALPLKPRAKSATPPVAHACPPAATGPGSAPLVRKLSKEETEARQADRQRLKKQHEENMQRAKEYAQKTREREKRQREDREKQEAEERQKREKASEDAKRALASLYLPDDSAPASQPKRPCKRTYVSPKTAKVSRVKPAAGCPPNVPMAWNEDGPFGPAEHEQESLVDVAIREGPCEPHALDPHAATMCMMNVITMVYREGTFVMQGLSLDPWMRAGLWSELVSKVNVVETDGIVSDLMLSGGLHAVKMGCGSFNLVVSVDPGQLPDWLGRGVPLRFTRPDKDRYDELRYQTFYSARDEISNAVFASQNDIGVKLHCVSAFSSPRMARSIRYTVVMAMEKADSDMRAHMFKGGTEAEGALMANSIVHLLFKASRCGVAFFDIKPGNILRFKRGACAEYRLTDYDPVFFVVTRGRDWRALLLLNLALLAVHVRNFELTPVSRGFLNAVAPLLRQLLRRRSEYNGAWLFAARSVQALFESPRDSSDFELQRLLTGMCTSYFYGGKVADTVHTMKHRWEKTHQRRLRDHWLVPANRTSWPVDWFPTFTPLIEQLVDAALSGIKTG